MTEIDPLSAITLSALFYFLLKNPRCYSKLQAEIAGLPYYPNNPAISYATAQSLPYLNACINESMRLHVVTRLPHDRVALPPGLMVCGQHIPAGTDIGVYGRTYPV
jgi:cytochrome P450